MNTIRQIAREKIELLSNQELESFGNDWINTNLTPKELMAKYFINRSVYDQILIRMNLYKREKIKSKNKSEYDLDQSDHIANITKELKKYKQLYEDIKDKILNDKEKDELIIVQKSQLDEKDKQLLEKNKQIMILNNKIEDYKELFFKFSEKLIKKYAKHIKADEI